MVEYKTNGINNVPPIKKYRKYAIIILLFLIGASAFKDNILELIKRGVTDLEWHHFILYAATAFLTINWLWSVDYELDNILCKWLDSASDYAPSDVVEALLFGGFALLLGVLFFYIDKIQIYCGIFTIYSFVNIYFSGIHMFNELADILYKNELKINKCINNIPKNMQPPKIQACKIALNAIRSYWLNNIISMRPVTGAEGDVKYIISNKMDYFKNRYFWRILLIFIGSMISLIVSLMYHYLSLKSLEVVAYLSMSVVIIISEIWIDIWRVKRDRKIRVAHKIWSQNTE